MKVTVYTVPTCQFSKHEKEYLSVKGVPYEEKNLEENREWLTEMLALSNNFAGTPVTKVEKDNGQTAVLKGFTEEEFNRELGLVSAQPAMKMDDAAQKPAEPAMPVTPPVNMPPAPTQTPEPTPSMPSTPVPHVEEPKPEPVAPPPAPSTPPANDALASILADLQQKAGNNTTPAPQQPAQQASASMPNIPDFPKQ